MIIYCHSPFRELYYRDSRDLSIVRCRFAPSNCLDQCKLCHSCHSTKSACPHRLLPNKYTSFDTSHKSAPEFCIESNEPPCFHMERDYCRSHREDSCISYTCQRPKPFRSCRWMVFRCQLQGLFDEGRTRNYILETSIIYPRLCLASFELLLLDPQIAVDSFEFRPLTGIQQRGAPPLSKPPNCSRKVL